MLSEVEVIDALLSYSTYDKEEWSTVSGYEKLLNGEKRTPSKAIGNKVTYPYIGEVELVYVGAPDAQAPGYYGDDAAFYQGYEHDGFIIVKVGEKTYRKRMVQDSYGRIQTYLTSGVVDDVDALVEVTPTQKTVEVWE